MVILSVQQCGFIRHTLWPYTLRTWTLRFPQCQWQWLKLCQTNSIFDIIKTQKTIPSPQTWSAATTTQKNKLLNFFFNTLFGNLKHDMVQGVFQYSFVQIWERYLHYRHHPQLILHSSSHYQKLCGLLDEIIL